MSMQRPTFETARSFCQRLLLRRGWSPELVWVAREVMSLDIDDDGVRGEGADPQLDEQAVAMVYRLLVRENRPIIFECLGHHPRFTVITLLGDDHGVGLLNARYEIGWNLWFSLDCPYWPALNLHPARDWAQRKQP